MNRNKSHWILLILALTVSASLMHEVIVHDNTTCAVCVQFHSSPPAIDNPNSGFAGIENTTGSVLFLTLHTTFDSHSTHTRFIRGPPTHS